MTPALDHPRYAIKETLGQGAQGRVVRVVDRERPELPLVAKIVLARSRRHENELDTGTHLTGEFALLSRLRVPGLVRVHDFGRDSRGVMFLVEDLVEGDDAIVALNRSPPEGQGHERAQGLTSLTADLAETLSALHDAGFVHGDVKPSNVRVPRRADGHAESSRAMLLDLGACVARADDNDNDHDGQQHGFMHTPAFAAPEVRAGAKPSVASDLFSLGATLWACAVESSSSSASASSSSSRTNDQPPAPTSTSPKSSLSSRSMDRSADALRVHAPWVPPSLADLIAALLAEHPADRPESARHVLGLLGQSRPSHSPATRSASMGWEVGARATHIREDEVRRILGLSSVHVVYVTGSSGAGKSHLVREVMTRALLEGRETRFVGRNHWSAAAAKTTATSTLPFLTRLVAWLRGAADAANPFEASSSSSAAPLLLILDDLHAAPTELVEAVESFRCRMHTSATIRNDDVRSVLIVGTTRTAPKQAETIELGPLDDATLAQLLRTENVDGASKTVLAQVLRECGGLPGWLFASLGRVPLTADAALARVAKLSDDARFALALVATFGGAAPYSTIASATKSNGLGVAACFEAGLLEREHDDVVRLASMHLAADLTNALASYAVSDCATKHALEHALLPAASLAAISRSPCPPERRTELLDEIAKRARSEDARSIEIEALLALVADPAERSSTRLLRLERLVRDAGTARTHPRIFEWLAEAAAKDRSLAPLAERRRADERARAGDMETARAAADHALELARDAAATTPANEIYALATRGSISLWCAEWASAADRFREAHALIAKLDHEARAALDAEEIARLDHNLGVVELYRGHAEEAAVAFERSIAIKRALGDRVGVRACLLNLGLALTRIETKWNAAEQALSEAMALADTLGEPLGRGWCLAARADLDVRRKRARDAERHVAEAELLGDVVPKTVRADLAILRVQIALIEGDGRAALAAIPKIDPDVRESDALVDARTLALEARARLSFLPADRRGAARAAIASIRRARAADLPEAIKEATSVLREARRAIGANDTAARTNRTTTPMDNKDANAGASASASASLTGSHERGELDAPIWEVLRAIVEDPFERSVEKLTTLCVREARAERALVALVDSDTGAVHKAWGVDLDGLAIAEALARVDVDSVRAARSRSANNDDRVTVLYQPNVTSAAGNGSRLTLAHRHAAIIIEHRFRSSAFDHVSEAVCKKWLTVAEIILRSHRANAEHADDHDDDHDDDDAVDDDDRGEQAPLPRANHASTALPRRDAPLREFPSIVGRSATLRRSLAQLDAATDVDLPVLIEGETGTGKEVFARALHDHGPRRSQPFVAVNCAAIADSLFEAELFGHSRGAFTGADRARGGLLARAEGGTLLLDEMGELALARQATLLRALEERRYRPVGSDDDRPFNVRIIAATNRDLDQSVSDGTFRKDLLYRLRVLRVVVPPLRERRGDVELLLRHFLARAGSRAQITTAALELLESYEFPGNVRELQHLAQRLAASRGLDRIDVANLPREVRSAIASRPRRSESAGVDAEREDVENALTTTGGNISRAAGLLGLTRHGLKKRMLRLGLRAKQSG